MTERTWLNCADPWRMKDFLRGKVNEGKWSDRKSRLFGMAVACWPESVLLESEKKKLADVFRHIAGNPFRPFPATGRWPETVIQLAEAMEVGQDCHFALHDALIEAGHAELAEHFKEKEHPKGCWAVDLLLGKG